nr:lanthionine synthetase LanC family protein [Streptomyces chartreusis]
MTPGRPSRAPNYSHGTAGIAAALAVAGTALDRQDFIEAAVEGARHVLSVGSLEDAGFVVPHTIPPSKREVEPVTYTWCHGPAGTSHLFTALAHAGVAEVAGHDVDELRHRCMTSILTSGLPQRLRPGFWDNDGRCCGTAGVGDVLLDAAQDCRAPQRRQTLLRAAHRMGDALVDRVIRDEAGARWRFLEHREDPPLLPPRRRGCRARQASRPTFCASPGTARAAPTPRSWTARTSGGPCRRTCGVLARTHERIHFRYTA